MECWYGYLQPISGIPCPWSEPRNRTSDDKLLSDTGWVGITNGLDDHGLHERCYLKSTPPCQTT